MLLSDYLIDVESTIMDAMQKIDRNSKGIVYLEKDGKLAGVITDGDIRRFLLKDGNILGSIAKIAVTSPQYLFEEEQGKAYKLMDELKIRSVPIVNRDRQIVKIYFDNEVIEKEKEILNVPVVIMAGGKGTRLYPYTQILPKPLIPIGEKTITEHIMLKFREYGCNEFAMIVNYKKNFIKSYFVDNEIDNNVEFIEEKEFLGTGGGLKLLDGKYDSTIFMTNCDILIEEDYSKVLDFHKEQKNIVTMVCAEKNMTIPYGTVEVSKDGRAICLKEKPEFSFITNTGFYVLEPEFIHEIPDNTFIHITDIIQKCIDEEKNVGVYTIPEEKWLDMGKLEELEKMKQKLNVN